MFDASHPASCVLASADTSSSCCCNETLAQLLAAASAAFDSNHDAAKICIQRAAELLQVSGNREGHRRNESRALRGGLAPWQMIRAAAHIELNISSNIRVPDLAAIAHLSVSHFSRAFTRSFGEKPHAYITRQRMRRAQVIMLNSREPLAQIALDCGMSDQAHFTRVFRKIFGINPGVWRRLFCTAASTAIETPHAQSPGAERSRPSRLPRRIQFAEKGKWYPCHMDRVTVPEVALRADIPP
jgi:AraC family transcriptional regulator